MKPTGDLFRVTKDEKDGRFHPGRWYWYLQIGNSPSPNPGAVSGTGYRSRQQALKALEKAKRAFAAAAKRQPFLD